MSIEDEDFDFTKADINSFVYSMEMNTAYGTGIGDKKMLTEQEIKAFRNMLLNFYHQISELSFYQDYETAIRTHQNARIAIEHLKLKKIREMNKE